MNPEFAVWAFPWLLTFALSGWLVACRLSID